MCLPCSALSFLVRCRNGFQFVKILASTNVRSSLKCERGRTRNNSGRINHTHWFFCLTGPFWSYCRLGQYPDVNFWELLWQCCWSGQMSLLSSNQQKMTSVHSMLPLLVGNRDTRNMLSKMSFFVSPKSPFSSKISSKYPIFVSSYWRYLICKLISKSV